MEFGGLSSCDTARYGDQPSPGPFPLRSTIPAGDTPSRCTDDGSDLFGRVVPAVDVLAGAKKGSPSDCGDTVPLNEEVGDVASAVHGSGQETQEGEVLDAPDAQHQGVLERLAQHMELEPEDAASIGARG